ncbi:MAG: DUF2842 domain-containing protein, partial [Pseudomonadota bacterium]
MQDKPNIRNLIGMFAMLLGLAIYGLIIAEIWTRLENVPFLVEMVFYIFAGLIWLWPARALVRWML